jgi:isoleucyl-tRNA synthetase
MSYPKTGAAQVASSPRFPALEEQVLQYWADDGTFVASVENRPAGENGSNEFVFYDGPPFANGLPHYGHLLTGYVKDVVPRYQTMRGRRVERAFGWDCHGLPAEVEAEKQLGITHKSEIDAMGVATFNDVLPLVGAGVHQGLGGVRRPAGSLGRLRQRLQDPRHRLHGVGHVGVQVVVGQGLGLRGLPRARPTAGAARPRSATPRRAWTTSTGSARTPPSPSAAARDRASYALIWTTTPWTLPSNLAAAVHRDIEYVVVTGPAEGAFAGERVVIAADRLGHYERELGLRDVEDAEAQGRLVQRLRGADLLGRRYTPPFDFFAGRTNAHQVLEADYVTTDEGTGIVHIAPAFGEEDKVVTDAADIEPVVPVDSRGQFTAEVPTYAGQHVFDANKAITRDLREAGLLLRLETYDHPYPHCWRCDNALIYRAVSSWFVQVTAIRDRMVELNQDITWVPEHVKDGSFGQWLANARDWSISRNRFWGSPIPVWVSDDPAYPRTDVYGSLDDLERDFGVRPSDLHRPFVDELTARTRTTRPGARRCAGCRRCSTAGSSPAPCRSRRCTTPSRTPTGSSTTTRATSSSSTSARPAAGSTRCTCSRQRCSTGRPSAAASATASCSATTAAR